MYDRPSPEVVCAIERLKLPDYITRTDVEAPVAIRSAAGCKWTETVQFMYSHVREDGASQACMLWDDDLIFSDDALEELQTHLDDFTHDRIEALWLHAIDPECKFHDVGFPPHWATCLFRVYEDDDWSDVLTRTVIGGGTHSPIYVARSANFARLNGRVLHMGYCSPDQRESAWNSARQSGQTCAFFRTLSRPPAPQRATGSGETSDDLRMRLVFKDM